MIRRDAPPELQALLDAYIAATGLRVTMSYQRQLTLSELHAREITAADVTAVLLALKAKIARGDKGFTDASLDFRNAMEPDTLEERALKLRQAALRRRGALPKADASRTTALPDGGSITRLEPPQPTEVERARVSTALKGLVKDLEGR